MGPPRFSDGIRTGPILDVYILGETWTCKARAVDNQGASNSTGP